MIVHLDGFEMRGEGSGRTGAWQPLARIRRSSTSVIASLPASRRRTLSIPECTVAEQSVTPAEASGHSSFLSNWPGATARATAP